MPGISAEKRWKIRTGEKLRIEYNQVNRKKLGYGKEQSERFLKSWCFAKRVIFTLAGSWQRTGARKQQKYE